MRMQRLRFPALWVVALIVCVPIAGAAWTGPNSRAESVIYSFGAGGSFDGRPTDIKQDATGAIYGTIPGAGMFGGGYVYRLNPPTAGLSAWTKTTLYNLGASRVTVPNRSRAC
jgi:hypothetical protein